MHLMLPVVVVIGVLLLLLLMLILLRSLVWHAALAAGRIWKPHHGGTVAHASAILLAVLPVRSCMTLV